MNRGRGKVVFVQQGCAGNNRTNIYLKEIEYKGNTIHLKKPLFEKFFLKEGILSVLKRLNDDDI